MGLRFRARIKFMWLNSHFVRWYYEREKRRERAKKGYCFEDVLNMGGWLLNIIPKMLKDYKGHTNSFPEQFIDEWFSINREKCEELGLNRSNFYVELNTRMDDEANKLRDDLVNYNKKKWDEILDKIIYLFEEANEETCSKKNPYKEEYLRRCISPDGYLNKKELNNTPQKDEEYELLEKLYRDEEDKLYEYRTRRGQEALSLLARHLHDLWY